MARKPDNSADQITSQVGKTIQRLRKAYNLSLNELSEQSGVAKSIISQIERNETNPTLATLWRLSQALDVSIDKVLATDDENPVVEKLTRNDTPVITSEDGKMKLAIIGYIKTLEWVQIYDVTAEAGAVLDSEGHQRGSIECLTVTAGCFEVEVGGVVEEVKAGETLRYRCDVRHIIRTKGQKTAHATMVCLLKASVMA